MHLLSQGSPCFPGTSSALDILGPFGKLPQGHRSSRNAELFLHSLLAPLSLRWLLSQFGRCWLLMVPEPSVMDSSSALFTLPGRVINSPSNQFPCFSFSDAPTLLMNDSLKLAAEMQHPAPCSAFVMPSHALTVSQTQNRVPEVGADRRWSVQQPWVICSQQFRPVYSVKYAPEYVLWLSRETGAWRESSEVLYCTVLRVSNQWPETVRLGAGVLGPDATSNTGKSQELPGNLTSWCYYCGFTRIKPNPE